jgi:hypothetical protein
VYAICAVPVLAEAEKESVPLPVPLPEVIVSQGEVGVAVQEQPVPAVTLTEAGPPEEPIRTAVGLALNVQEELKVVKEKTGELALPQLFLATICQ